MEPLKTAGEILIAVLVGVLAAAILFCWPVQLLWNWLMPELFGLKEITFGQSWGLLVLCGILFKPTMTSRNREQ